MSETVDTKRYQKRIGAYGLLALVAILAIDVVFSTQFGNPSGGPLFWGVFGAIFGAVLSMVVTIEILGQHIEPPEGT